MTNHEKYTELLQWHKGVEHFDYDPVIDWAIELIRNGQETENILILASFSKPIDRNEIKPYITGALQELNLTEKFGHYSSLVQAHYSIEQILAGADVRRHLSQLSELSLELQVERGLYPFYLLYHAWSSLEQDGTNYYYKGATLENINEFLHQEAEHWIGQHVHGVKGETPVAHRNEPDLQEVKVKKQSIWTRLLRLVSKP